MSLRYVEVNLSTVLEHWNDKPVFKSKYANIEEIAQINLQRTSSIKPIYPISDNINLLPLEDTTAYCENLTEEPMGILKAIKFKSFWTWSRHHFDLQPFHGLKPSDAGTKQNFIGAI